MDKQQREYIHHLMLQYSDAMVRLTYRRVGDWHLAEDLVQETFLTACCKSERVCGHKKPVAWLFETLNNLTLRESRRFYHTEVSIEDIAESYELTELPMACHKKRWKRGKQHYPEWIYRLFALGGCAQEGRLSSRQTAPTGERGTDRSG